MSTNDPHVIWLQFQQFTAGFQSAVIASLSPSAEAEASYAPVIQHQACFYVYISELANHTANLMNHPQAELLFIEDESQCPNIFARVRASIKVQAEELPRDHQAWLQIMDLFSAKHPQMMAILRPMQDFHLFKLTPIQARFVKGFAQAYTLDGEQLSQVRHRAERGHQLDQPEH